MKDSRLCNFDVNYFLKSCIELEKSYENILDEKKKNELSLSDALKNIHCINEKYEKERKNNLELSQYISKYTDELVTNQNCTENYEIVKKQNTNYKKKIETLKREKEQEKATSEEKIRNMENKYNKEIELYEVQTRENIIKLKELENKHTELKSQISSKDLQLNRLSSALKEIEQEQEKVKLKHELQINNLIKANEENIKKKQDNIKEIINNSENLTLTHLKNKHKLLQKNFAALEKEHLNLKKSINKTTKMQRTIAGNSINQNNQSSYKI
ncbi:conserved Plasmodium protein, unknown function [Plasmodium chabaudi chabaudi]|uniref:Uncharacterized protein n=2 Tax=Plasmodium chabaudi TaxID=5825 RepID=A0A4V0KCE3_PLACU|nr:conserved Plasmodium protein, unknown function [Plasmodium chabaudi chabaudi]SCN62683.1 conserved Plasmodium protein, unknown function [Plasmodium chabaudi adami]VTZ70626.1 conserved Plasmodium protein, unknown function [Plasmodium chabaudi chabaudi]|eukprot:XP_016654758.1 conserved Plasmodium protein, unknown function [Plasmodium chabaudi chabaudi]